MPTGRKFYWIKLKDSFIDSEAFDCLVSQPNGAEYALLYLTLCVKTINSNGRLQCQIGEVTVKYDVEKIRRECKWFSSSTIKTALALYKKLGLIQEDEHGVLSISDFASLVGSETDAAVRKRRQRNTEADVARDIECDIKRDTDRDIECDKSRENVTVEIRDKRLDIRDKSLDIRDTAANAAEAEAAAECPFVKIRELYHTLCPSFPRIMSIEGNRKKAVAARWRACHSLDVFSDVFRKAESSEFLKGRNGRNWSADFDWMMVANNFAKIREGKYSEQRGQGAKNDYYAEIEAMEFKRRMSGGENQSEKKAT